MTRILSRSWTVWFLGKLPSNDVVYYVRNMGIGYSVVFLFWKDWQKTLFLFGSINLILACIVHVKERFLVWYQCLLRIKMIILARIWTGYQIWFLWCPQIYPAYLSQPFAPI